MRIEALRSLSQVAPLAGAMTALNLGSRRPCPFATYEYLEHFLTYDEYDAREDELLFLAAFDGDALVGYLPLRRHRAQTLGVPFTRIGLMVSHDTDRPHVVARPEQEAACAEAMRKHLLAAERGWSLLELPMQDDASALAHLPALHSPRFYERSSPSMPNTTVPLGQPTFADYFKHLSGGPRKNLSRLARRLFDAGQIDYVRCDDERGGAAMLELYLDVERRSWKHHAGAGVARSGRRLASFRRLVTRGPPFVVGVEALLLNGVAIAALISGVYANVRHGLETCFDRAYEALGAGHFMTLLTLRRAIAAHEAEYNFNGNYAYYKASLGGVVTPTQALQLYRVGSAPWLRAHGGALKRWLHPPQAVEERFNPDRRRAEADGPADEHGHAALPSAAERERERTFAEHTLASLAAQGVRLHRERGDELGRSLPFSLHTAAA